jgi:hypothetical protein
MQYERVLTRARQLASDTSATLDPRSRCNLRTRTAPPAGARAGGAISTRRADVRRESASMRLMKTAQCPDCKKGISFVVEPF